MANGNIITGNLEQNFRAAIGGNKKPISSQDFGPDINGMRSAAFEEGRKSVSEQMIRNGRPTNSFASSSVSNTGIGMAKVASSGVVYTQPQFFSPIHTPINWQIPSKRKECYQWSFVSGCELMTCDFFNKPIEDVVAGDTLVTHDGTVQTVDKTTSRYVDTDLFSVKFDGNYRGFSVTSGHKVYIIKREDVLCKYSHGGGTDRYCDRNHRHYMCTRTECHQDASMVLVPVLTKVEDIKEGDFLYTPIPNQNINGEVTTVEQARMLGYYCAEGCRADSHSVILTFNETETEYIDEVARLAKVVCRDFKGIRLQPHPSNHSCDIVIKSKELAAYCERHCSGRAREKTLSKDIVNANPQLQLQFLAAYWNGDGCQSFAKGAGGNVDFRTASKRLAEQLVVMLSRCNYPSRIYYTKTARKPDSLIGRHSTREFFECYTVIVAPSNGGDLFNIGSPVHCGQSGRKPSVRLMDGKVLHRITSVESQRYQGKVYDVRVPGNYSVICNGVAVAQCRFFYENEPKVAQAIEFHSKFPVNRFTNECSNRYVKRYFDKLSEKLNLIKWLRVISHEVHLLGDCFPFLEVDCEKCGGRGVDNHGKVCEHDGGSFKRLVILNPECAEVYSDPISPESLIAFLPNDELRTLISKRGPGHERFSKDIVKMIMSGVPIPLDNRNVSHIKYCDNGYNKYGIGMVRRLFPILAYKTKLMTAQWIIAERLILPIKVAKVGSDERPASAGDLADINSKLAQVANDPNLTLVTHHAFELDWFGACHSADTEVLTSNGWVRFDQCSNENIQEQAFKVGTVNIETGLVEFQEPLAFHEVDHNGEMVAIKGKHIDVLVTPEHQMLASQRQWDNVTGKYSHSSWRKIRADQVIENTRFRALVDWGGIIPVVLPYKSINKVSHLTLEEFLTFLGYYLSEGGLKVEGSKIWALHISQSQNSPCFNAIKSIVNRVSDKVSEGKDDRREITNIQFIINDCDFARKFGAEFGCNSLTKSIPRWVLDLPKNELAILLGCMMEGDGSVRFGGDGEPRFTYSTVSPKLAGDVQEIVMKLGYDPKVCMEYSNNENHNDIHRVMWSTGIVNRGECYRTVKERNISRVQYSGKVYCFTVPNGTLITRRNGRIGIHGNSGKVMQLTNEFEIISQEILDGMGVNKVLLNGEGPCFHPDVEILTEEGWKHYLEVADGEKIGTFNPKNGHLEFQDFKNRIVKDYEGDLVHFRTNKVEMLTTTNHRMWLQERTSKNKKEAYSDWKVVPAEDVKYRSKFRACVDGWQGKIPAEFSDGIMVGKHFVTNWDAFCRFVGYYVSEGWATAGAVKYRTRKESSTGGIAQKTNSFVTDKIRRSFLDSGISFREDVGKIKGTGVIDPEGMTSFALRTDVVEWLLKNIPGRAKDKHIPKWIRNLPQELLAPLLEALLDGDGSLHKHSSAAEPYNSYITSSKVLADNVMEVAMKLGYAAWISYSREEEEIFVVNIPSSGIGKFPVLDTLIYGEEVENRRKCISRIPYKGKVWCFEVPNEFLVVRLHGKPLIAGNTYSSAAIGVEVMIDKLDAWRHELSDWVEQRIYLQVAKMMGFIEKNEWGEHEYVYPKIKWDIMHLRDQQQMRTFMLQLHEKGAISTQTMLKSFDIDYNQEVELLRYERAKGAMSGAEQGDKGGGIGGGFGGGGGLPDMGGLPGGDEGGGLADLGGGAGGGAPGGAPAGGDAGGMGAAASSSVANIGNFGGKVLKKRSREKISKYKDKLFTGKADEKSGYIRDGQGRICFTGPERELMRDLSTSVKRGEIRHNIQTQFDVNAMGHNYSIDFAMPDIKLGIEVDGALFHSTEEQVHSDRQRDQKLAQLGWTILRFTDKEVESRTREIIEEIIRRIIQKENWMKENSKA